MTPQDQIMKMTTAIRQAIKIMGDRFGSTEQDVATAIHELKMSMQKETEPMAIVGDSTTTKQAGSAGGTEAQGSQRNRSVRTTYRALYLNTVLYRTLSCQSQPGNVAFSSCRTMWSFWDGAAHYCAVSSKACAPTRARPPRL